MILLYSHIRLITEKINTSTSFIQNRQTTLKLAFRILHVSPPSIQNKSTASIVYYLFSTSIFVVIIEFK